ncbi:MAG: ferritin family protein [Solirubrobacteraceae bacterium]
MTTPPVKKLSDQQTPSRGGEAMRTFQFFTPAKRRATLYEDVTVDTQPSIHRHMDRGWLVSFEDGRGTWDAGSTALMSSDWYEFRDPGEQWERTFYQLGSSAERQIEAAVRSAAADRLFEDFAPEWVEFLRNNLQVPAYAEHGLWLASATIARDCLSDTITHAVAFQAALKQRLAQSIVLYALDLESHFGAFPIEASRSRFLEHPAWRPVREYVELLRTALDWGERIVAMNLCFEPLVGVLIRRELGIRAAGVNGDNVTPVVSGVGQLEWQWIADWTTELMRFLLADARHGNANREVVAAWLTEWRPRALSAAARLSELLEEFPIGFEWAPAMERVLRDADAYYERAGLAGLAGVSA